MYGLAEIMSVRLPSPVEYIGAVPAVAIVPFFFAGSLFPITSLPHWLGAVAKVLPLTHALALFRYGIGGSSGVRALHNIWGLQNATEMAMLSLLVAWWPTPPWCSRPGDALVRQRRGGAEPWTG